MSKSVHGTVAGNLIRFEEPLGLPDGTGVEVVVRPIELWRQEKELKIELLFGSCRNEAAGSVGNTFVAIDTLLCSVDGVTTLKESDGKSMVSLAEDCHPST